MGTTTNGLPYPESTDFVTDGAQAIEDLAVDVDKKFGLYKVIPPTTGHTNITFDANGNGTIGSTVGNFTVVNAFSSKYENYKITISGGVGSTNLGLRFNFDGNTSNYLSALMYYSYAAGTGTPTGVGAGIIGYWNDVGGASTGSIAMNMDLFVPYLARPSSFSANYMVLNTSGSVAYTSGFHNTATSFTGFRIQTSTGTLTGGTVRIYGYN